MLVASKTPRVIEIKDGQELHKEPISEQVSVKRWSVLWNYCYFPQIFFQRLHRFDGVTASREGSLHKICPELTYSSQTEDIQPKATDPSHSVLIKKTWSVLVTNTLLLTADGYNICDHCRLPWFQETLKKRNSAHIKLLVVLCATKY